LSIDLVVSPKGRMYCRSHSKFYYYGTKSPVVTDYSSYRENIEHLRGIISLSTCKACDHYTNNTCKIPKKELKKTITRLKLRRYKCTFCGSSIHSLYNVIYKQQVEQERNITIPFLCCECYDMLRKGKDERTGTTWIKHRLVVALVFCISLITIPVITTLALDASITILLILLIPPLVVGFIFFLFDYKSWRKLRKSLKNSDLLKDLI